MVSNRLVSQPPLHTRMTAMLSRYKILAILFILCRFTFQAGLAVGQDSTRTEFTSTEQTLKTLQRDQWLGKDKLDHAIVSAGVVAAQFYFLHTEQDWERPKSRQYAATSTLVLGIAKEIYDGISHRGTPSWKDLLADVVGIGLAVGIMTQ